MTVRAQRRAIRRADSYASSVGRGPLPAGSSRRGALLGASDESGAESPADWDQLGAHPMELPVKRPSPTLLHARQRLAREGRAAVLRAGGATTARTAAAASARRVGGNGVVAFAPTVGGAGQRPSQPPALGGHLRTPAAPRRRPPARPGRSAPGVERAAARGQVSSQRRVPRPTQRATRSDAVAMQRPVLLTPASRAGSVRASEAETAAPAGPCAGMPATPGVTAATTLRALSVLQETAQSLTHELTADAGLSPTQRRTLTLALETTQRRQSELLTAADLAGVMLGVAKGMIIPRGLAVQPRGGSAAPHPAAPTPAALERAASATPKELTSWLGEASPTATPAEARSDAVAPVGERREIKQRDDVVLFAARTDRLERELAELREQSAAMAEQLRATASAGPSTPAALSKWLDAMPTAVAGGVVNGRSGDAPAAKAAATTAQRVAADLAVLPPAAHAPSPPATAAGVGVAGEFSFMCRYILRESCSQYDSLPLTYLTMQVGSSDELARACRRTSLRRAVRRVMHPLRPRRRLYRRRSTRNTPLI
jgi:hypothetical protein